MFLHASAYEYVTYRYLLIERKPYVHVRLTYELYIYIYMWIPTQPVCIISFLVINCIIWVFSRRQNYRIDIKVKKFIYIYIHIYIYVCVCVYIYIYVCVCVCVCIKLICMNLLILIKNAFLHNVITLSQEVKRKQWTMILYRGLNWKCIIQVGHNKALSKVASFFHYIFLLFSV